MVEMQNQMDLGVDKSALCTFCEMAVYWVQAELKKQRAKEGVFKYVNEVRGVNTCFFGIRSVRMSFTLLLAHI